MSYQEEKLETLEGAAKPYRLRDPNITNDAIAVHLSTVMKISRSEKCRCFFYSESGDIVAIRTGRDFLAIFHYFTRHLRQQIADLSHWCEV